jgi:hypothetical protein
VELATSKAFPSTEEGDGPGGRPKTPTATIEALIEKQRVLLVKLQSTETTFERTVELRNTLPHLLPVGHLREILLVLHIDDNAMLTRKRKLSKAERALGKSHRSNNEGDGPSTHWNTYGPSTDEIRSPHLDEPYKMLLDKYSEHDITNIQHGKGDKLPISRAEQEEVGPQGSGSMSNRDYSAEEILKASMFNEGRLNVLLWYFLVGCVIGLLRSSRS